MERTKNAGGIKTPGRAASHAAPPGPAESRRRRQGPRRSCRRLRLDLDVALSCEAGVLQHLGVDALLAAVAFQPRLLDACACTRAGERASGGMRGRWSTSSSSGRQDVRQLRDGSTRERGAASSIQRVTWPARRCAWRDVDCGRPVRPLDVGQRLPQTHRCGAPSASGCGRCGSWSLPWRRLRRERRRRGSTEATGVARDAERDRRRGCARVRACAAVRAPIAPLARLLDRPRCTDHAAAAATHPRGCKVSNRGCTHRRRRRGGRRAECPSTNAVSRTSLKLQRSAPFLSGTAH